jgi:hypothetical protein
MKNAFTTATIAVALGLTAAGAFAADSSVRARPNTVETSEYFAKSAPSTVSRSAVQADLINAQKAGTVPANGDAYKAREQFQPSSTTRAAVQAETIQALKTGGLPRIGERS